MTSNNVCSLLVPSSHNLTFCTGFKPSQISRTQVQHTQLPPFPRFNTSATNRHSLAYDSSSFLLTSFLPVPPIPSATQATSRRPLLNSAPNSKPLATPPIAYLLRLSPRSQECAVRGPASVHSARLRSAIARLRWI